MANNQFSFWYPNQVVTATEMMAFSQDIYQRCGQITANGAVAGGTILNLESIIQVTTTVNIGAGNFRFPNTSLIYMPNTYPIIGNANPAIINVPISTNGFIVARYSVSPNTNNNTNYTFPTTYQLVGAVNPVTDCMICIITAGVITSYGNYYINQAATNQQALDGSANNVAITPASLHAAAQYLMPTGTLNFSFQTEDYLVAVGGVWLACNGQSVNSTNYPNLAILLGVSGTFNLPNFSGITLAMAGNGHTARSTAGADEITIAINQMPSHTHYDAGHVHGQISADDDGGTNISVATIDDATTSSFDTLYTTISYADLSFEGGSTPITVIQPTYYLPNIYIFGN